jgi:hypothetical protein
MCLLTFLVHIRIPIEIDFAFLNTVYVVDLIQLKCFFVEHGINEIIVYLINLLSTIYVFCASRVN